MVPTRAEEQDRNRKNLTILSKFNIKPADRTAGQTVAERDGDGECDSDRMVMVNVMANDGDSDGDCNCDGDFFFLGILFVFCGYCLRPNNVC